MVIFGSDLRKLLTFNLPEAGWQATQGRGRNLIKTRLMLVLAAAGVTCLVYSFYYCAVGEKSQDYTIAKRLVNLFIWLTFQDSN